MVQSHIKGKKQTTWEILLHIETQSTPARSLIHTRRAEYMHYTTHTQTTQKEAFEVILWRAVTPGLKHSAVLPINKCIQRTQGVWCGSPAKWGSLDNYHHGISQPCSISCYFWAMPFEVSLCFICLSLNTAGLLGQARQLSSLNVGPLQETLTVSVDDYTASLVSWWYIHWEDGWFSSSPLCWGPLGFRFFRLLMTTITAINVFCSRKFPE